jgi:hypothetical protein
MLEALRGILPVSRLIMLVGSGSPIGPRQTMLGCSERGMTVELLWTYVAKMASHAIFQYNVLVIDIDNTTLGLI